MDVYGWKGLVTRLCLTFLLFCCNTGSSIFFDDYGVVTPDDPRPFVGENLTLFCNLTKHKIHENSSRMYFSKEGTKIRPEYVDIINSRTIRLHYPIEKPEDEGLFVCYLDRVHGSRETIGSQYVEADYRPVNVTSINCTAYNWNSMTCHWDLRHDYHHMEYIEVSLVWTISGVQKDCPILTKTSCEWPAASASYDGDLFLPGAIYIMTVDVLNKERRVSAKSSPPFRIQTREIVKPDPVHSFHDSEKNATSLHLKWSHSDKYHGKLAEVQYFSEWNHGNWTSLPLRFFKGQDVNLSICNLTPFTDYTIRVGVWAEGSDGQHVGYRSDWEYMTTRTGASVPEVGPEMCASCFTDLPIRSNERNIIIYWKHIPWPLRYNTIRGYHLHLSDGNLTSLSFTNANNTSCLVALQADRSYTLQLYAVTSQNELSRNFSSIHLTPIEIKPQVPSGFVVETHRNWTGNFYLQWDSMKDTVRYMVIWCRGSRRAQTCDDEPKWIELAGDSTHYELSVNGKGKNTIKKGGNMDHYLIGVSRLVVQEGSVMSSGICWTDCIYFRGEVPSPPENVNFAEVQRAGSLEVNWDRAGCGKSKAFITHYVVYFCETDANNKCKANAWKVNATASNRALLDNMEPETYYRVTVAAVSEWGEGQQSHPAIFAKVSSAKQVAESTNYTIIGVILAVFVLIILTLIGICKLRRHYLRNREKFGSLGNLPPLPHGKPLTVKDSANIRNRPLPQIPPQPSTTGTTDTNSGFVFDHANSNNYRNRNGKHKSITSETSLLGHEDSLVMADDDNRRRHRSSTSERAKLLPEEGRVSQEKHLSKYDSDSGTESRYSSDHDYASVDSGGASSGKSEAREEGSGGTAACGFQGGGNGYLCKDGFQLGAASAHEEKGKSHVSSKPAPKPLPPPPFSQGTGYVMTAVVPPDMPSLHHAQQQRMDGSRFFQEEERQSFLTTFGTSQPKPTSHPARLSDTVRSGRSMPSTPYEPAGGSCLIDDRTLPLRPAGVHPKFVAETELNLLPATLSSSSAPPLAAATAAKVQHTQMMHDPAVLSMGDMAPPVSSVRGYTPHSAMNGAGHGGGSGDFGSGGNSEPSEPIYSPPWGSNTLLSIRPLSAYMLQLPQHFFHEPNLKVHEGPTTEL